MRYYCFGYVKDKETNKMVYRIVDRVDDIILDLSVAEIKELLKKNEVQNLSLLNNRIIPYNMEYYMSKKAKESVWNLFENAAIEFFNRYVSKLACNSYISKYNKSYTQYGWGVVENMLYIRTPIYIPYGSSPVAFLSLRLHLDDMTYDGVIDICHKANFEESVASWMSYSDSEVLYVTNHYKNISLVIDKLCKNVSSSYILNAKMTWH